jgi:enterochelin esterase-like enzyme
MASPARASLLALPRIGPLALAAALLTVTHRADAQWTSAQVTAPGVQYATFQSAAAGTTVSFHVYLPPEYTSDPARRFPVIYWLHGSGSPTAGIPWLSAWYGGAMAQGKIPPMIVVFPNGMGGSMWCNSKDGTVPMERVVIDDLIPHVDATFRTIASRRGRILEGFSMGGQGTGRLGLRRPDLFAGISLLGAGPLQLDFMSAPKGTDIPPAQRAALYQMVWGSDPAYYLAQHPWTIATARASAHIAQQTVIRQGVGQLDAMLGPNQDLHLHLAELCIPHQFIQIPGVGHDPALTLQGLGEASWAFYNAALATPCPEPADLDCSGTVDGLDLGALLSAWGAGSGPADLNGDGHVDGADLSALLAAWGPVTSGG